MRPAWAGLKLMGQANKPGRTPTVELGRKYCPDCGRWRHLVDFPHRLHRPYSYCTVCTYRRHKATLASSALSRERKREAGRFYTDKLRREAGLEPRPFRHRRTVIDRAERTMLDPGPLLAVIRDWQRERNGTGSDRALGRRAGVPPRSIYRLKVGESRRVRIDVADKLAVAVGVPLSLLYPLEDESEA